jgi:guanylate kinase
VSRAVARRGIPFVVAAPSGAGKTTVCREALERDSRMRFSISHTTRPPRAGERDGVDYHFVSDREFRLAVDDDQFLEHAEYAGRLYGTSWQSLRDPLAAGFDLLLEIEVQGARQVRDRLEEARFIFLLPPSMKELERRLRGRGTDRCDAIERRLAVADQELSAVHFFDYALVNDALEDCVAALLEIVAAEREGRVEQARARHGRRAVFERWQAQQP